MLWFKKVLKMGRSTHLEVPSRFASSHNFLKFRSKNQSKVVKFDSFSSYEENKLKVIFASTRISFVCDKADHGLALSIQKTLSFIAVASSFGWFMLRMTISVYLLNVFTLRCVAWKYLPSREKRFWYRNGAGKFMVAHVGEKSIEKTFRELTLKIKANLTAPLDISWDSIMKVTGHFRAIW